MEIALQRLLMFTSDLQRLTGKSMRTCQRLMQQIRDTFALQSWQPVTIYHVSTYMDTSVAEIAHALKLRKK